MVKCASQASIGPSTPSSPKVPQEDRQLSTRSIQGLPQTAPHVTQAPRKRQRALTKSKLARYFNQLCTADAT